MPVAGSQRSDVHAFPSEHVIGVPAWQLPLAPHHSVPLHAFPSEQEVPAGRMVWLHPVVGEHESRVQSFQSSHERVAPDTHAPVESQVSSPSHRFPLGHGVPTSGMLVQPDCELHPSAVHALRSSQSRGVPGRHEPCELHSSAPLHAFPSEHEAPVRGALIQPVAGSHVSDVQELASLQFSDVPCTHVPWALQVSRPLHAFPSEQDAPDCGR